MKDTGLKAHHHFVHVACHNCDNPECHQCQHIDPNAKGRDYSKYLSYIDNTGGSPTIEQFEDDWEPIGTTVLLTEEHCHCCGECIAKGLCHGEEDSHTEK